MSPEEALRVLDQAASVAPLDRASHIRVQQAVVTLNEAITPKPEKKEEKKS